jgi:type IV secretory pathway TraG/TraD family ATPase VirD4
MLGSATEPLQSYGSTQSYSPSPSGHDHRSLGQSSNTAAHGRPLFFPDEILRLSERLIFIFQRGFPAAILARRIEWFRDRFFNKNAPKPRRRWRLWWFKPGWLLFALGLFGVLALAMREKEPPPVMKQQQQKKGGDGKQMKAKQPVMWR